MLARAICVAGLLVSAALATAPAHAGDELTSKQIMSLAPGTFHAVVQGKYKLTVTLARDGTVVGKIPGLIDRGHWTVRGNELCIVLPTWTRGRVVCSAVVADNGWYRGRSVAFRKL